MTDAFVAGLLEMSLRLPKTSWVKISQIRMLSVERLGRRIGALNTDEVDRIIEGLFELVGD